MTREPQGMGAPLGSSASVHEDEHDVREALHDTHDRMTEGTEGVTEGVKQRVRQKSAELKGEAEERVRQKSSELRSDAEQKAQRWTSSLGEHVDKVARALRAAGDSLEDQGEGRMSAMSAGAAETVERLAGYLREENPTGMVQDLEDMARKNPTTFVTTTFVAGLLVGRFFRSGDPASRGSGKEDLASQQRSEAMPEAGGYAAGSSRREGAETGGAPSDGWEDGL